MELKAAWRREIDRAERAPTARQQLAGTPLFDGPPLEEERHTPVTPVVQRRRKSRAIQEAGARRWIDAGKPIAVAVARKDDKVTAASFREAASALGQLPPTYDNQRALGWISAMFNELVREGSLEKARHPNGAPVRVYGGRNNDQVVYRIPEVQKASA